MRTMIMILAISLASITPGLATAKKDQSTPGCVVLIDDEVMPGITYVVKVVRDPGYPGAWRNPTFTIEANYSSSTQTASIVEIQPSLSNVFDVTYVNASLPVPIDATGTVTISATVEEPLNKRKTQTTTCSTTAIVL